MIVLEAKKNRSTVATYLAVVDRVKEQEREFTAERRLLGEQLVLQATRTSKQ